MKVLSYLESVVLLVLWWGVGNKTSAEELYSVSIQWIPTGNPDQVQIYTHYSWSVAGRSPPSCASTWETCIKFYSLTNKTLQTFGRMTDYTWECVTGCPTVSTLTNLGHLFYTSLNQTFQSVQWEAGDETLTHDFTAADNDVELGFRSTNGSHSAHLGNIKMNLAVRNDTGRINVSPSLAVLPFYVVPLGCQLTIDLHSYDGDGDKLECSWSKQLQSANLDPNLCRISVEASVANGFVAGTEYTTSVFVEDYSTKKVTLSRKGSTRITTGPFSRTSVMFTVHVISAPADAGACADKVGLSPAGKTISEMPSFSIQETFQSSHSLTSFVTMGHLGASFMVTKTSVVATIAETNSSAAGIYRACVMAYNQYGVPGQSACDTVLVSDDDDCAGSTCVARGDTCYDHYRHHTCIEAAKSTVLPTSASKSMRPATPASTSSALSVAPSTTSTNASRSTTNNTVPAPTSRPNMRNHDSSIASGSVNLAVIIGAAVGGVLLLATVVVAVIVCKYYMARRKRQRQILDDKFSKEKT